MAYLGWLLVGLLIGGIGVFLIMKRSLMGVSFQCDIVLETNTWVDPEHYSGDQKATIRFNERMNGTWEVVRQLASEREYPLVEIYEQKKKETMARNWDQRIRNQQLSQDKFGRRILDGSEDAEMKVVPGWFVDNHPNANGVKIIADEEFKTITRLWPKGLPTASRK